MPVDTACLVGALVGCAVHLLLRTSFVRLLFGFALLGHAGNLAVVALSGEPEGKRAPIIRENIATPMVDPLPQAFVLTAIVINFAITAYFVVLLYRVFLDAGTTNANDLPRSRNEEIDR